MHIATTTAQRVRGPTGLALTRSRAIDSLAHRFSRTAPATLIGQILGVAADCGGPLDGPQSRRLHWFQAEVHCLQCGRLVGRVLGPVAVGCPPRWPRHAGPAVFRPAGPNGPARALVATQRFSCTVCGGSGVLEEFEESTTGDFEFDDDRLVADVGRRCGSVAVDPRLAEFGIGVRRHVAALRRVRASDRHGPSRRYRYAPRCDRRSRSTGAILVPFGNADYRIPAGIALGSHASAIRAVTSTRCLSANLATEEEGGWQRFLHFGAILLWTC